MTFGNTFGNTHTEVQEMIRSELLQTPMARGIARKAGLRQGVVQGTLPQVLATFSAANSDAGYEIAYTSGATPFPNASITADLTDYSQLRLIANVVATSGGEGVVLATGDVSVPLAVVGLSVGETTVVNMEGTVTLDFTITAPVGGSLTVGLVQLQGV